MTSLATPIRYKKAKNISGKCGYFGEKYIVIL
jgi:hypothetical protein